MSRFSYLDGFDNDDRYDSAEIEELRRSDNWRKQQLREHLMHPDPRDPDFVPPPLEADEYADDEGDDSWR
jgi:hypothetical protein